MVSRMDILSAFQYGTSVSFFRDHMPEAKMRLASKGFLYDESSSKPSTFNRYLGPYLHRILIDAIWFANLLNATPTNGGIDLYTFSDILHSMCYRLIRYHLMGDPKPLGGVEDVYHIGLTLFAMSLFMQFGHKRILRCDLVFTRFQNILDRELGGIDDDVLLWLALMGGMWADKRPDQMRNHSIIRRLASGLGVNTWSEALASISHFPWIKAVHEKPGFCIWNSAISTC